MTNWGQKDTKVLVWYYFLSLFIKAAILFFKDVKSYCNKIILSKLTWGKLGKITTKCMVRALKQIGLQISIWAYYSITLFSSYPANGHPLHNLFELFNSLFIIGAKKYTFAFNNFNNQQEYIEVNKSELHLRYPKSKFLILLILNMNYRTNLLYLKVTQNSYFCVTHKEAFPYLPIHYI